MCDIGDCAEPLKAKGLCAKHYARLRRRGSAEDTKGCHQTDPKKRFEVIGWVVDNLSGCWNWSGHIDSDGYGSFRLENSMTKAHRASYILHQGVVPPNHVVRHKCDNPSCVNPEHLELGLVLDNVWDCISRNRRSAQNGDNNHNSKLVWGDVREIRRKFSSGTISQTSLAKEYGVSQVSISLIIRNKTWVDKQDRV